MKIKAIFSGNLTNFKKSKGIILLFALSLALIGEFFVFSRQTEAWSEPNVTPPGGNIAAPINISASPQTKLGPLALGGGPDNLPGSLRLYPSDSLRDDEDCTANNRGEIYYYQDEGEDENALYYCDGENWQSIGSGAGAVGDYVLLNEDNLGWTSITADCGDYAILGRAHTTAVPSYGIYGQDGTNASAYAGYFQGNVKIASGGAGENTNLTLDTGVSLFVGGSDPFFQAVLSPPPQENMEEGIIIGPRIE